MTQENVTLGAWFVDRGEKAVTKIVPYEANLHLSKSFKFVCMPASGSQTQAVLLVGVRKSFLDMHVALVEAAKRHLGIPEGLEPAGAGAIDQGGRVASWCSIGYNIETPKELRPLILKALGIE